MKKTEKKLGMVNEKGQTTVLFSVLLLLVVTVGLTILQTGHGVVQRVRFRQFADSAVLASAASYCSQSHHLHQMSLLNHYTRLTYHTGQALAMMHEAGSYMQQEAAGYDTLSTLFSSMVFQQKTSNFNSHLDSITDQPLTADILPSNFQNEAGALMLLSAVKTGEHTAESNQNTFGGSFQQLEYLMLPDAFFWSDQATEQFSEGFYIIAEMPSPRFFFLNLYPYASIHRRGRLVSSSYAGRVSDQFSVAQASKEAWEELCNELEEINENNSDRVLEMKELSPQERPEELAPLISLWEALLNDYVQWAEAMTNNKLFVYHGSAVNAYANLPAFSTLLNSHGEMKAKIISIAEQKGMAVSNEEQMRTQLAENLRLRDFFSESSTEQSVNAFQARFFEMMETINANPTIPVNELEELLNLLQVFNHNNLFPDQSMSSILSALVLEFQSELNSADQSKADSLKVFFHGLSENMVKLFLSAQFFADGWISMSPANMGIAVEPRSSFYESAVDFFEVSLQRLESN